MRPKIPDTQKATLEMARQLGLSTEEYQHVCRNLERIPTFAELGVFSAMYSEHCSYKSSRKYLKRFPTTGKRVLQGPGENAGILDIGSGWAVAFKMESHNHPSFIEPYQGAATGVGGILRDIFTMGARPIANMDGLCFGAPDDSKTAHLVRGVVKGIGDYGNSVGVPTVAGQTFFHPSYNLNPLVNAFTLGLVRTDGIYRGYASGEGNTVVYVGAKTGRDGVHGATMASKEFSSEEELDRPTVQVGDPFTEKLLLEATLEAMRAHLMVGIQDMGAAGLTSSSFEMAHRAKMGMNVDLSRIPTREKGMSAYELLLSESQERMLLVAEPSKVDAIKAVYEKWDLHAVAVGKVVAGNRVVMTYGGETVVDLPVELVVDAPKVERPSVPPSDLRQRWFIDRNRMLSASLDAKVQAVLQDFNFASPEDLVEKYDSMVGNRTLGGTFDDAAVLQLREIEGKNLRLAVKMDCNPRVCWLHPREGGRRAVVESFINLAIRGAEPIGITDCLNFGSPENPEVMWQFGECVEGISEACEALKIPVISGNVSFYNDTDGKPIHPTPMIGMAGLMEESVKIPHSVFTSTQLEVALLGPKEGGLGGSSFAAQWFKRDCGKPDDTDLQAVERMVRLLGRLRQKKRLEYALHDVSDGGLITAILEMVFRSPHAKTMGFTLQIPYGVDVDSLLFGETIPRVLIAYDSVERTELENMTSQAGVPFTVIGQTDDTGEFKMTQGGATTLKLKVSDVREKWRSRWKRLWTI